MTIEATLERIAVALEAIVESQGIVAGTVPPKPHDTQKELPLAPADDLDDDDDDLDDMEDDDLDDDLDDDDDDDEAPPPPKKKKKVAKKKKAPAKKKKKAAKKKQVGKDTKAESEYTADEVRAKLQELQLATGSAAEPKSILKANGASTFGQLNVGRYDQVVAAVDKLLEDYE